jgi:hypothetical protein
VTRRCSSSSGPRRGGASIAGVSEHALETFHSARTPPSDVMLPATAPSLARRVIRWTSLRRTSLSKNCSSEIGWPLHTPGHTLLLRPRRSMECLRPLRIIADPDSRRQTQRKSAPSHPSIVPSSQHSAGADMPPSGASFLCTPFMYSACVSSPAEQPRRCRSFSLRRCDVFFFGFLGAN